MARAPVPRVTRLLEHRCAVCGRETAMAPAGAAPSRVFLSLKTCGASRYDRARNSLDEAVTAGEGGCWWCCYYYCMTLKGLLLLVI